MNTKLVKRLSETLWFAHADTVNAMRHVYKEVQAALDRIAEDKDLPRNNLYEESYIYMKMDRPTKT